MRLLLTAFEPFGGSPVNPAEAAAALVPDTVGRWEITRLAVPVVYGAAGDTLAAALAAARYDAVLCVGQAGGRTGITVERVAINVEDAVSPDNAGAVRADEPIVPDAPAAYFATLPIKAMVAAVQAAGFPAAVSNSAGTYVCNHLLYRLLHLAATEYPGLRGGFVHVPFLPEQGAPSMEAAEIAAALAAAIETI